MRILASVALIAALSGCRTASIEPEPAGQRVLFVGNSYVTANDIPVILESLAAAGGDTISATSVAANNVSLLDHWNAGPARSTIITGSWKWVVLQQGPSSTDPNRDTLRIAVSLFAPEVASAGARLVLFSAWPASTRRQDFERAIESYTLAASAHNALLAPIASAWLAAWARDPALALYADGLHASREGAYLSALVLYGKLLSKSPANLPASFRLKSGELVNIDAARAAILRAAAVEALSRETP